MAASARTSIVILTTAIALTIAFAAALALALYRRRRRRRCAATAQVSMTAVSVDYLTETKIPPPVHIKHTRKLRHETIIDWPSPSTPTSSGGILHIAVLDRGHAPARKSHPLSPLPTEVTHTPSPPSSRFQSAYPASPLPSDDPEVEIDTTRLSTVNVPPSSPPALQMSWGAGMISNPGGRTLKLVNGDLSRASSLQPPVPVERSARTALRGHRG